MTDFICSFSASRLNGFLFPLDDDEDLLLFFLSLEELPKKDDEDAAAECERECEARTFDELAAPEPCFDAWAAASSSSSPNGFASVSLRTLDLSWVTTTFRLGSS